MPEYGAVGVLEFYSVASAITAADVAAKAANVTLMEVHIGYAIGGKGYVTLTGDVGAVKAAVEAASRSSELLVGTSVIPRPAKTAVYIRCFKNFIVKCELSNPAI